MSYQVGFELMCIVLIASVTSVNAREKMQAVANVLCSDVAIK